MEIADGAKKFNFKTAVIAQKGREKTYANYYKSLFDKIILLEAYSDLTHKDTVTYLQRLNSIFIPHRYCQVYLSQNQLEKDFPVPVYGNKFLLKFEEREGKYTQYEILKKSGIDFPVQFENPKDIDRLVIVKVKEAVRNYERAFFFATNYQQYQDNSYKLLTAGKITEEDLRNAVIEEYIIGAQVNFNFFFSPIKQRLELMGTDTRRQTNIDGWIRLPSHIQMQISEYASPSYIESGHISVTVKESLLEKAFDMAEKLIRGVKKVHQRGIIGPFALQTIIAAGPPKERIVVFDLSLRIPGSPGTRFTPYSRYLFAESISYGQRIGMEIKEATKKGRLEEILS